MQKTLKKPINNSFLIKEGVLSNWKAKVGGLAGAGLLAGMISAGGHKQPQETPIKYPELPKVTAEPTIPLPSPISKKIPLSLDDAMEFIEDHEGIRYRTYKDSRGKKTIGVGFNLQSPGAKKMIDSIGVNYAKVKNGSLKLNQDQIEILFEKKTEEALSGARRNIDNFDSLPKDIQLVVVDMIYNLGVTGFMNFEDVVSALSKKDYKTMAKAMWASNWRKQVGSRAEKLVQMVQKQGGIKEDFEEVFSSTSV